MNRSLLTTDHITAYQEIVADDLRAAFARSHGGLGTRMRSAIARSLVLVGARLLPDAPAVVGGRVVVLERANQQGRETDKDLSPAA